MSRYDELVPLAQAYAKGFFSAREKAAEDIVLLVNGYCSYLGVPPDKVQWFNVDKDFKVSGEPAIGWAGEDMQEVLDGFWGCMVAIEFGAHPADGYLKQRNFIAVKDEGSKLGVRLGKDGRVFSVDRSDPKSGLVLFEHWFTSTKDELQRAASGSHRPIGFLAG